MDLKRASLDALFLWLSCRAGARSAWPNALPEHFFTFEVKRLAAMRRLRVETVQEGPLGQDREPGPHRLEPRNS